MSRRVIGYRDGVTLYRDEGPNAAHITGWGGSALGTFSGTTLTVKQKRDNAPRKVLRRSARQPKPLCQKILPYVQEPCARMFGHKDSCRSSEAMANARIDRRTFRRPEWNKDDAA